MGIFETIGAYFVGVAERFSDLDFSVVTRSMPMLLEGLLVTLKITTFSVLMGIIIGSLMGIAKVSKNKFFKTIATIYIDFIRGTPLLVQIFLMYFVIPLITGAPVNPYFAALSALSINSGAYIGEIVRSGIQSIDKGQEEAARSLGLSSGQSMMFVIFPQALKRIIPPLGNEFIAMLKDSSLVSVIAIEELFRKAQIVITREFRALEIYAAVAVIYLVLTLIISQIVKLVERRLKIIDTDN